MKGKFYFVGTPIGNLKDFSQNQIDPVIMYIIFPQLRKFK